MVLCGKNGTAEPMATREQYIRELLSLYSPVAVLSEKNGCKVLRLRSKATGRDLILRLSLIHI